MKYEQLVTLALYLTPGSMDRLEIAVKTLNEGVKSGRVRNPDFISAKDCINRRVEEAAEAFLKAGDKDTDGRSLRWMAAYHADALISGAHGVPTALKRAAQLPEYAEFISTSLLPLSALLQAAKPLVVKRVPGQKTEKQVAAERARERKEMTCQCCGRGIFAETGKIAHHGYERPGTGWQTASCMGARELPFEVSRTALGRMIERLTKHLGHLRSVRRAVVGEEHPLDFNYMTGPWNARTKRYVSVTRETFAMIHEAYRVEMVQQSIRSFDDIKDRELSDLTSKIRMTKSEIEESEKRYYGWKQTHERKGGQWCPV